VRDEELLGRLAALEHWLADVMAELKHPDDLRQEQARLAVEGTRSKSRLGKSVDDFRRAQSAWLIDEALRRSTSPRSSPPTQDQ